MEGADTLVDGRIAPRSGLASKNFIDTGAGVIDADYRGQVKVLLFNHAETEFKIKIGDRIAQLVLERVCSQTLKLPQPCALRKLTPAYRSTHRKLLKSSS
jgi:deoxyuridine 5'-triphosphate nucleotidohydrolase